METYKELSKRHETEFGNLPIFYAFSNKQFLEGLESFGLKDTDQALVVKIGSGGYARITDSKMILSVAQRQVEEFQNAIDADTTGEGFIFQMFDNELSNHEYCYTFDVTDALRSCGLTEQEVKASPALLHGLKLAKSQQKDD